MSKLQKMLIAAAGASALAVSASPAMARDYDRGDRYERGDRYDRGDRYNRGNRYGDYRSNYRGYNTRISSNRAVNKCVRAVKRHLRRSGRAQVTNIIDVRPGRYGNVRVDGRLVLQTRYNDDRGRFTCKTDGYGRPSLSFRGLWNGR